MNMYAVIRIRGLVHVRKPTQDTLRMLRLNKVNHCVVLPVNETTTGMIKRGKDYIAYGTIKEDDLVQLLTLRGKVNGNVKLTDEYVKENSEYSTIADFAHAVMSEEVQLKDLPNLKPLFRLHPPRKGHKGIKHTVQEGGVLGNHGENIGELLNRMR